MKNLPYVRRAKPVPKAWGPGYSGPPLTGTGSIAQQSGTNAALAEFFGMMLEQRFDVMNDRRDAAIDRADDFREYNLDLGRYDTQHENYMEELGLRQETEGISSTAQGDVNPAKGIFDFATNAFNSVAETGEKVAGLIGDTEGKPKADDYLGKAAGYKGMGPALNAKFPLMKGNSPEADAALAEFFGTVLEQRFYEQDDRRAARIDRRDDLREYGLDTGRYNAKHEDQMDQILAREYGADAVGDTSDSSGTSDSNDPVSNALAGFMSGKKAPYTTEGEVNVEGSIDNFFSPVGKAVDSFFDTSEFNDEPAPPRDEDDRKAKAILSEATIASGESITFEEASTLTHGADSPEGEALFWAIDKLSRPLYAVNESRRRFWEQDEDPTETNPLNMLFGLIPAIEGGDVIGSAKGTSLKDVGYIAGGLRSGFSGEDKTLSHEIIKEIADKDGREDFRDNTYYQIFGGLTSDIALDPLNLVGVGVVKAPVTVVQRGTGLARSAVMGTKFTRRVNDYGTAQDLLRNTRLEEMTESLSKSSAGYGRVSTQNEEIEIPAETIRELLGGNYHGSPHASENLEAQRRVLSNARALGTLVKSNPTMKSEVSKAMSDLATTLRAQREAALTEFGAESIREFLARRLRIKISQGKAKPSELEDLDTTFSAGLLAEKGVIQKANAYEGALFNVATSKEWESIGYKPFQSTKDLEAEHTRLVQAVTDAKSRLTGNAPASSGNSVRFAETQLQRFEAVLNKELDAIKTPLKDINDLLGPKWKNDFRFTDEESIDMYRQASHMVRTSQEGKALLDKHTGRIPALERQIRAKEKSLATSRERGYSTKGFERELESLRRKLARQQKMADRMFADYFVRTVKTRASSGEAFKEFTNAAEASRIDNILRRVSEERLGGEGSTNRALEAETNTARGIDETRPEVGEFGTEQPNYAEIDWLDFVGDSDKIPNHPMFSDRGMQLDSMERQLRSRLKGMRGATKFPDIGDSDRRLLDVPKALNGFDAETLTERLKSALIHNPKSGEFTFKPFGDPEVDGWFQDVVNVLDDQYQDVYNVEWGKLNRRLNEAKQSEVEAQQLSIQDEMLNNMFTGPEGGKIEPGMRITGTRTPSIKVNDKDLRIGSIELKEAAAKGEFPVGTQSHTSSQAYSKTIQGLIDDALEGDETVKHQSVARLRDYLKEYGMYVPDSPKAARKYITRLSEDIRLKVQPHMIEATRKFKKDNGLSLREARITRDRALGKSVHQPGTRWAKEFPKGVTQDEFMFLAMNSERDFHKLFARGPFRMNPAGKETSSMLTKRDATPSEYIKWAKENYESLMNKAESDRTQILRKVWDASLKKQAAAGGKAKQAAKEVSAEVPKKFATDSQKKEVSDKAFEQAFDSVAEKLKHGNLYTRDYDTSFTVYRGLDESATEEELMRALAFKRGEEYANAVREAHIAKSGASKQKIREIDAGLKEISRRLVDEKEASQAALKEAKEGRAMFEHRLKEDAVLRIASMKTLKQNKHLTIQMLGHDFLKIPTSGMMFRAVEKATETIPFVKGSKQTFANLFQSPASRLPEDLQLARARALGLTPNIIELNVKSLMKDFGDIPLETRKTVFESYIKGHGVPVGTNNVWQSVDHTFKELLPYFSNNYKLNDDVTLVVDDINRFLPQEFQIKPGGKSIDTVQGLVNAIRKGKKTDPANRDAFRDPYQLSWELRVAVEQALARKGLEHTIKESFGVKSGVMGKGANAANVFDPETVSMVKKLEGLGWEKMPELGSTHYIAPDVVPEVRKLLNMLEPRNITVVGRQFDKAMGYWKTMATIYNPGYYTRNGIGEFMSSWLAGVNDLRVYKQASHIMKYARNDGKELNSLKSQFPIMSHLPTDSVKGNRVLFTLRGGKKVTVEDMWVAYNDQGLKTGFINTEFDSQMGGRFSKGLDKIRSSPVGKIPKAHLKVRNFGEGYEDYLRMAHFVHAMKKSGARSLSGSAKIAAKEVRKYHFDYTDFTNFEKMTMMRVFPFYKWTRKALPLMMTMLFTKPGKVMAYPKVMNAVQNAQASPDELVDDPNGFAPNYQEIVPQWIRDLWGYKIAEDSAGNSTYFNMATPQMDVYKGVAHPDNLAGGLLNPLFRVPAEQVQGDTLGEMDIPVRSGNNLITGEEIEGGDANDFMQQLARTTPQGNWLAKILTGVGEGEDNAVLEPGTPPRLDEATLSFLSGLGTYENNPSRQRGEMMRRAGQ